MSMTMVDTQAPAAERNASVRWHEVEDGFWVGSAPGLFLGTVERTPTGYVTRDHAGVRIAEFPSADQARAALPDRVLEPRS
ncbi:MULTISPECIES: hypothetical protein [unclassified Microbacterium]|uniref:hypothetical protein n=1 Tax=unclassified Microbacterium TaxID=2609290 RepID=UPI00386AEBB6